MSKNFPPQEGVRADEFLQEMGRNPQLGAGLVAEDDIDNIVAEAKIIANSLLRGLNLGTCMTKDQASEAKALIGFHARESVEARSQSKPLTLMLRVHQTLAEMNGFVLECRDCLNATCTARSTCDPEARLESVQKRRKDSGHH